MPSDDVIQALIDSQFPHLDPDFAHLNHGSFGSAPKTVQEKAQQYHKDWIGCSEMLLYSNTRLDQYKASINAIGPVVNASQPYLDHIALIDNATTGACIIAQGLMWKFVSGDFSYGDVIIMWDCAYGAVVKVFEHFLSRVGARIIKVHTPFPLNDCTAEEANDKVVGAFHTAVKTCNAPIRLVMLEHVASEVSFLFPIKRLIDMTRSHAPEALIYADAAHAIGNVEVDLQHLDIDYYVSNCHKWFFTPQSCALFHSKKGFTVEHPPLDLHSPIISWEYEHGLMMESFWTGTKDISVKLVSPHVLECLRVIAKALDLGDTSNPLEALKLIQCYNKCKLAEYAKDLATAWDTHIGTPCSLMTSMGLIALPESLGIVTPDKNNALRLTFLNRFKITIAPVLLPCSDHDGNTHMKGYLRVSHQVYVRKKDIDRLKDAVLELVREAEG